MDDSAAGQGDADRAAGKAAGKAAGRAVRRAAVGKGADQAAWDKPG